jgi:hypothetical protein
MKIRFKFGAGIWWKLELNFYWIGFKSKIISWLHVITWIWWRDVTRMFPINISPERLNHVAAIFSCQAGSFPFTYLGLPLSSSKPTIQEFLPLVYQIERRLVSTSMFLTQGGKLLMVNSVLSSLPTFIMSTVKIPVEIIRQIDRYRRHCLWCGGDLNTRKPPWRHGSSSTDLKRRVVWVLLSLECRMMLCFWRTPDKKNWELICHGWTWYGLNNIAMAKFLVLLK